MTESFPVARRDAIEDYASLNRDRSKPYQLALCIWGFLMPLPSIVALSLFQDIAEAKDFLSRKGVDALLYDDCGKLLDCKFLKKEEEVEPGKSIELEMHLVDVGDIEPSSEAKTSSIVKEVKIEATNGSTWRRSVPKKLGMPDEEATGPVKAQNSVTGSRNSASARKNSGTEILKEWHVLYSTQKIQKYKKFHDGFLRIVVHCHQRRQVVLSDEDGKVLDSMYLKTSDDVNEGNTLELPGYLVEIGQERQSSGSNMLHTDVSQNLEGVSLKGNTVSTSSSTVREICKGSSRFNNTKAPREAFQILFDLKKPRTSNSLIGTNQTNECVSRPGVTHMVPSELKEDPLLQNKISADSNLLATSRLDKGVIEILNGKLHKFPDQLLEHLVQEDPEEQAMLHDNRFSNSANLHANSMCAREIVDAVPGGEQCWIPEDTNSDLLPFSVLIARDLKIKELLCEDHLGAATDTISRSNSEKHEELFWCIGRKRDSSTVHQYSDLDMMNMEVKSVSTTSNPIVSNGDGHLQANQALQAENQYDQSKSNYIDTEGDHCLPSSASAYAEHDSSGTLSTSKRSESGACPSFDLEI